MVKLIINTKESNTHFIVIDADKNEVMFRIAKRNNTIDQLKQMWNGSIVEII